MNIDVDFTKKQSIAFEELNNNTTTEVLFGGSAGGGKSFLGCAWLIINCLKYPGTRWLMGRAKLKNLKDTTLNTFFDIASDWALGKDIFKYNQQQNVITFYNGSSIILKDLFHYPSDPNYDSLGSLEITGAFIDEVNQITELAKLTVASRIRYKLNENDLVPKMYMSCNPSRNWVYEQYYKKHKNETIEPYKVFIQALVTDNPFIDDNYIRQLERGDENMKKRLLFGQWEYEDKAAMIDYNNIIDMFKDYEHTAIKDYYISVDVARKGKDKSVIMLWDGLSIIKTISIGVSLMDELKETITNLKNEYGINNNKIVIDEDGVGGGLVDFIKGSNGFINNSKAYKGENYQNLKTQCYYKLAQNININNIEIFNISSEMKEQLTKELLNVKQKNIDTDGKLQILSKEEVKGLIGNSPDFSDAMMMRMFFEYKTTSYSFQFI